MEHRTIPFTRTLLLGVGTLCAVACDDSAARTSGQTQALTAECSLADQVPTLPAGAWVCPETLSVECNTGDGTADPGTLYVADSDESACEGQDLVLSNDGPFGVGEHTIVVSDAAGQALCSAQLDVVDTKAPVLESHTIQLWPPNHKFHSIAVSDCVSFVDACNGEIKGEFIWASSDEPVDDLGDGHHAPDIQFDDCGQIAVRSERAGPRSGRVYKLGVRVVDGAGNAQEGECSVIVDHDQRGVVGADDGESYRITFDGSQGGPACDGIVEIPAPPADPEPPVDTDPPDAPDAPDAGPPDPILI